MMLLLGLALAGCSSNSPPAPVATDDQATTDPPGTAALLRKPGYKVGRPYRVAGRWYTPSESFQYQKVGVASWYGPGFHGRTTANGEQYDMRAFTAAHRTLQLPSVVHVENLENGKTVIVRINDRGPYIDGREIDLSRSAAEALEVHKKGLARVRISLLPHHSREIARMAKDGATVKGLDAYVAVLNKDPPPPPEAFVDVKRETQTASAPDPSPKPKLVAKAAETPSSSPRLYLQAAAFSKRGYAERAEKTLQPIGPVVVTPLARGDRTLYRVRVGPYATRKEARLALQRVREVGFEGAHLVSKG